MNAAALITEAKVPAITSGVAVVAWLPLVHQWVQICAGLVALATGALYFWKAWRNRNKP